MAHNPNFLEHTITADGTVPLGKKMDAVGDCVITVRGTFGGGTLTFGYMDTTATFRAFETDATLTAAGDRVITLCRGMTVAVDLTGATGPSVVVGCSADGFQVLV